MWKDIIKSNSKEEILEGLSILQQNIKPDMIEPRGGHTMILSGIVKRERVLTLDKNFDNFYFGNMRFIFQIPSEDTYLNRSEIQDRVVSFIKGLDASDLRIDRYTTEKWTSTSKDRIVFKKGRSMLTIGMEKIE